MGGNLRRIAVCLSTIWLVLAVADVRADVVYNDTVSPDLSNNPFSPTAIPLPFGTSSVILRTRVDELSVLDVDYFRIELPSGGGLAHLYLASDVGDSGTSFIALQQGPALTFDPQANDGGDAYICLSECLGFSHFGPNETSSGMGIGGDLLVGANNFTGLDDSVAQGNFTPPLATSPYTFWVQEFNGDVTIQLDFVVPAIYGDYNHDGTTNAADYTVWRNSLGTSVIRGSGADGNGDGVIDFADYSRWKTNYGAMPGSGSAVPEPSTIALLLIGMLATPRWAARRRRSISIPG